MVGVLLAVQWGRGQFHPLCHRPWAKQITRPSARPCIPKLIVLSFYENNPPHLDDVLMHHQMIDECHGLPVIMLNPPAVPGKLSVVDRRTFFWRGFSCLTATIGRVVAYYLALYIRAIFWESNGGRRRRAQPIIAMKHITRATVQRDPNAMMVRNELSLTYRK